MRERIWQRESDVVGTALRAVRNDAPVMLRRRFIAARSASAPYHLSHWAQYVGSCCLCCFLVFISSVVFAAPRLIVPSEGIAFGEVAVGSNVVGKVVLRNEGSTTVSVSRVKACCGAKAELSSPKIPPNGCECCQCENVANLQCCQFPIGHWPLELDTFPEARCAVAVPLAECVVGPLLVFSRWVRLSAAAVSAMLAVFIMALSQAALRGLDVSCGCFGGTSSSGPLPAILRDLLLLVPSLWLTLRRQQLVVKGD